MAPRAISEVAALSFFYLFFVCFDGRYCLHELSRIPALHISVLWFQQCLFLLHLEKLSEVLYDGNLDDKTSCKTSAVVYRWLQFLSHLCPRCLYCTIPVKDNFVDKLIALTLLFLVGLGLTTKYTHSIALPAYVLLARSRVTTLHARTTMRIRLTRLG